MQDAYGRFYPSWGDLPVPVSTRGRLLTGSGVPSNSLGDNGDVFVNIVTGDFYTRSGDVWSIVTGAPGGSGESGVGSPEGVVAAAVGTTYVETSAHQFWIKESGGSGTSGWVQYV